MKTLFDYSQLENVKKPCVLTIGFFDGMHLGHRYLLENLKKKRALGGTSVVFTFENHPLSILQKAKPHLLSSLENRLKFFQKMEIDIVIVKKFTNEFAHLTGREFLTGLRSSLSFSDLILGEGATFGKDESGNATTLIEISKELNFSFTFIPKLKIECEEVSSSRIRSLLENHNFLKAKALLGRSLL